MSDTSGLPNTEDLGVPAEDDPARFESGDRGGRDDPHGQDAGAERDAQAAEPDEDEPGQDSEAAEPPPADFDPTEQPSNPDLVKNTEPPD